ncbi:MAG: bifunctional metallophosphatase/5'-nucleotidase [Methanospirillum sp.]|uniref:bifunctional metallophosphatase/5'-nucleotidase n=1 Tax=Methanospirillum sp. TaxID=45200 RepID=UPI0023756D8B|nr:bifunctional metallophosphatase/5'-nucleotidase [Methanospirillum sp.]MDD1729515.1 bifunctional metallophosphatase/5'-nucleotidase [Methanospirillum sp.]
MNKNQQSPHILARIPLVIIITLCIWSITPILIADLTSPDSLDIPVQTPVNITILAVNDFHGQITSGKMVNNSPVGGLGSMASYLMEVVNNSGEERTIIALPGDITGASTPESALLLDEPTLLFYNLFSGNASKTGQYHPISSCQVVATVGNHEFDKGITELLRKINGGNQNTTIPHLQNPYPGSATTFVSSNIVYRNTSELLLPPYTIRTIGNVSVAFIGAVTNSTPSLVTQGTVTNLTFLDEADSINQQVEILKEQGIHAFVILLHEGGTQTPYDGPTRQDVPVTGNVVGIVSRLDSDVDIVLSAHTDEFTNAFLPNAGGDPVLVTQAYSYGKGFANVSLAVDPSTDDIIWKTATIVTPYSNVPPGSNPNPDALRLLNNTLTLTNPLIKQVISSTEMNITTDRNADGESNLYDLITDSMRDSMQSDFAVLQEEAVRSDILPGSITIGTMYKLLPFGNSIVTVHMTGDQIRLLLEQQWNRTIAPTHLLQISGFNYTYDETKPISERIISITRNGSPLEPDQNYSVATIGFLAAGGDGYTVMQLSQPGVTGSLDVDVLTAYIKTLQTPLVITQNGRILRAIT